MASRYHDSSYNQRRMIAFGAIVAVHLFIAWAFISGFGQKAIKQGVQILETTIIKPDQPKDLPPPPPKPQLDRPPPPSVPVPIINVQIPIETPPMVVTKAPPPAVRPVMVSNATPVKIIEKPDCGEDYYPPQEKRLGHEGSAVVKICFSAQGRVEKSTPIEIITSSGYPALDQAVGQCMSAGRYKAATVDGKPAAACQSFKVTYRISEAK